MPPEVDFVSLEDHRRGSVTLEACAIARFDDYFGPAVEPWGLRSVVIEQTKHDVGVIGEVVGGAPVLILVDRVFVTVLNCGASVILHAPPEVDALEMNQDFGLVDGLQVRVRLIEVYARRRTVQAGGAVLLGQELEVEQFEAFSRCQECYQQK